MKSSLHTTAVLAIDTVPWIHAAEDGDGGPFAVISGLNGGVVHLRGSWDNLEGFARLLLAAIADKAQDAAERENEGRESYPIADGYECERPADWDGFDDALDEEEIAHRESADEWGDGMDPPEMTMIQREHRVIYATRGAL